MKLLLRGRMWSHVKLKMLYLPFHKTYGHQTHGHQSLGFGDPGNQDI